MLAQIDFLDETIATLSERIEELTRPFSRDIELLDRIPGVDKRAAEMILAEIGPDMSRFPTDQHLASHELAPRIGTASCPILAAHAPASLHPKRPDQRNSGRNPNHPYLAFPLVGIGIEYLGRALDTAHDWNHVYTRNAQRRFDRAITTLFPQGYHNKRLRQNMRNGLLHFYAPHPGLALGRLGDPGVSKRLTEANHPYSDASGNVTLVIEFFFNDFRVAGDRVIGMRFPRSDKMSRRFHQNRSSGPALGGSATRR